MSKTINLPVSYTHLDVYKRQDHNLGTGNFGILVGILKH